MELYKGFLTVAVKKRGFNKQLYMKKSRALNRLGKTTTISQTSLEYLILKAAQAMIYRAADYQWQHISTFNYLIINLPNY